MAFLVEFPYNDSCEFFHSPERCSFRNDTPLIVSLRGGRSGGLYPPLPDEAISSPNELYRSLCREYWRVWGRPNPKFDRNRLTD